MEMDLSPKLCDPQKLAIWFAFWGEVKSRPTYRKICDEYDRYYDGVVQRLCGDLIEAGGYAELSANACAEALTSMTNGLWLSRLISPQEWNRQVALDAVMTPKASAADINNCFIPHLL